MLNLKSNNEVNYTRQMLARIEERLTRIESKLHSIDGVTIKPKVQDNKPVDDKVKRLYTLTDLHFNRIDAIQHQFGNGGWFTLDLAASWLDLKQKDIANLLFLIRKNPDCGFIIEDKDIPNKRTTKMYLIKGERA